tara:strand:- start:2315 stop:2737 length:423 start_codon:yes stop_codon:yes gene_type:complete
MFHPLQGRKKMSKTHGVAMPISELCDRLTIAQLKLERLSDDELDKVALQKQIEYYEGGLNMNDPKTVALLLALHEINGKMWDAEYAIRKGLDDELGLEEIGRRALNIRDLNRERVSIKNDITILAGQPEFADCKMNHASS